MYVAQRNSNTLSQGAHNVIKRLKRPRLCLQIRLKRTTQIRHDGNNGVRAHMSLKENSLGEKRAWVGDRCQRTSVFPSTMTLDSKTHFIDETGQKPTCLWYAGHNSGCNSFLQRDTHLHCHTDNSSHRIEALLLSLDPSTWKASQSSLKRLEDEKEKKNQELILGSWPKAFQNTLKLFLLIILLATQ